MKWKTIAIIFIILFTIETVFFVYLYSSGSRELDKKNQCIAICIENQGDSYAIKGDTCQCHLNGKIVYVEELR